MWVDFTVALIIHFNLVPSLAEGVLKIDKVRRGVKFSTKVEGIELTKKRRLDAESIGWPLHSGARRSKWVLIEPRVSLLPVASNIEVLHHLWMHINRNLPIQELLFTSQFYLFVSHGLRGPVGIIRFDCVHGLSQTSVCFIVFHVVDLQLIGDSLLNHVS